jgi:ubiquitin C-terminal hydrolase
MNNDKIIIDLKVIINEKNIGIKFGKIYSLNDKIYKKTNEKKDSKNIIINFNEQDKIKNLNKNNDKNLDDSKYNLDFKPNSPYIKNNYSITPLIGLQDISSICYINSILQCFCHKEKFVEYFKYNKFIINKLEVIKII